MAVRYNTAEITHFDDAENGVMKVTAIARHAGVLRYRTDSGDRFELVPPDLIRGTDESGRPWIAELANQVATNEHPPRLIKYDDALKKEVEVGRVLPKVKVYKDDRAEVEIEVYDSQTQDEIRQGKKKGLSVGYQCGVEKQDGWWGGQRFDYVQCSPFRCDHVALVANPRAPEAVISRFDSAEDSDIAIQIEDARMDESIRSDECESCGDDCPCKSCKAKKKKKMMTTQTDSLESEFEAAVLALINRADGVSGGFHDALNELLRMDVGGGCGKGWTGTKGNCKRVPKGTAKKVSAESNALKSVGKSNLGAKNKARLEELRSKMAKKQAAAKAVTTKKKLASGEMGRTAQLQAKYGKQGSRRRSVNEQKQKTASFMADVTGKTGKAGLKTIKSKKKAA